MLTLMQKKLHWLGNFNYDDQHKTPREMQKELETNFGLFRVQSEAVFVNADEKYKNRCNMGNVLSMSTRVLWIMCFATDKEIKYVGEDSVDKMGKRGCVTTLGVSLPGSIAREGARERGNDELEAELNTAAIRQVSDDVMTLIDANTCVGLGNKWGPYNDILNELCGDLGEDISREILRLHGLCILMYHVLYNYVCHRRALCVICASYCVDGQFGSFRGVNNELMRSVTIPHAEVWQLYIKNHAQYTPEHSTSHDV